MRNELVEVNYYERETLALPNGYTVFLGEAL